MNICRTNREFTVRKSRTLRKLTKPSARPAIRSICPKSCAASLAADEFKIYEMIWKRTVASQMSDARGRRISITIEGGGATFRVGGKTIDFPGYLRAYVEGSDDPQAELADKEKILPQVVLGQTLRLPRSGTQGPYDAAPQPL